MKKVVPFCIVGILVLSGLGAVVIPGAEIALESRTIMFSELVLHEQGNYLTIEMSDATSSIHEVGKPLLPMVAQVFTFPAGTVIKNVDVVFSDIEQRSIAKPIIPVQKPVPLSVDIVVNSEITEDESVYGSAALYPSQQWSKHIGYGLKGTATVVYLAVWLNPVQYSPATSSLFIAKGAEIHVNYVLPSNPQSRFSEEYDLLIITPEKFSSTLQPLVEHKNNNNVKTLLKTTEDIYAQYTTGRDDQEKIKLCIYDVKNTNNITYVILFGGRDGQRLKWLIPERVTNNNDGWEMGYASDLYYADVYKYNDTSGLNEFEDWDSNHNGKFAEWGGHIDVTDYYPDVYLGRLSARSTADANTIIDKIITYESSAADPTWFKKTICVAGDTFVPGVNGEHSGVPEGEVECDHIADLMEADGFTVTKLYTSDGTFAGPDDVIAAIHDGAGFVAFSGHGNPSTWGNHAPESDNFTTGLSFTHMRKLKNQEKLPVIVVGGCHNSQFNVSVMNLLLGVLQDGLKYFQYKEDPLGHFWRKEWVPWAWSEWLVRQKNGGSIATIGCTGLGYGDFGYQTLVHRGGWIDGRFFDAYANQSLHVLGQAHSQAIIDYINLIGGVNNDQLDRKTIEEWCLLGDPSLMLGGIA